MFKPPRKTLQKSLDTLLDNAPEYVADVYFDYPEGKLWAHRAILLARVPMSFQQRISLNDKTTTIDIAALIPYNMCQTLLRYWYTANFHAERSSESPMIGSLVSSGSTFSAASTKTSVSSMITDEMDSVRSTTTMAVRTEIEQLEKQLGCELLSTITGDTTRSDFDQLVCDLERMRTDQLASDVHVTLFTPTTTTTTTTTSPSTTPTSSSSPTRRNTCFSSSGKEIPSILFTHSDPTPPSNDQQQQQRTSFPAHRFMLAAQSPYFYAMFCTQFRESSSSTVHLPGDLFSPAIAEATLRFFYTDSLKVPDLPNVLPAGRQRLAQKKYALRILQQMFPAGDYLGHGDTLCEAALYEMDLLCHGFKCVCADCAALLPSMLWFADKNAATMPTLRSTLIALYSDPIHALAPLWSQQPFAILVGALALTDESLAEQALLTLFSSTTTIHHDSGLSTLVDELRKNTLENVTKHNAIHVLHSLHLCLSKLRGSNPFPTWSSPVLDILNPIVHHTVEMVASNFDFYCVEYPILLSCVDGIGHGFSVDFLEFLLNRVLTESIRDTNAGILYQGIVRDLIGRQEMVQNLAVDGVLVDARKRCAEYLARRWVQVKAQKGFSRVEKEVMRHLSEDIGVPYRALTKPIESDFTAMFSFKSKPGKVKSKPLDDGTNRSSSNSRSRRLSLSGLRRQHSNSTLKSSHDDLKQLTRTRSLSNDMVPSRPVISDTLSAESINKLSEKGLSSQPLIRLLSLESEARRQRQEGGGSHGSSSSSSPHSHHSRSQSLPTCLADALLPLDLPIIHHQASSSDNNAASKGTCSSDTPGSPTSPRPSRLKFELPTTPLRAKAPMQKPFLSPSAAPNEHSHGKHRRNGSRRARSPHKSRWGFGGGSSDISDDDELITMVTPVIGAKVELLRRPLPTLGMIKFVGNVNFAKGIWVGVELESRLGTNDGQVEGVRYFRTDPQRGVFVKIDDFKVISLPNNDGAPLTI
ncbi:hypothetical protein RO3G_00517 [Lichtheimia corymbifera JMRC:FSU:9682]|uniref:CAP-Gly domain-containing protein n=1 Tax=Lichtheimia corymbifera JMRC:FSU:9682 TaxID=1263082 RepID=A0A068S6Q2_9FUNG|nr:hypothetical protein RO3G_00517 [Lichtheimia corymbifera JMRC:FSU:9682]